MDTSKLEALKAPKPTIASRRPMLNSQRSMSVLSINTSATHHDLMRRNSSSTTARYHRSSSSSTSNNGGGITQTPTPPPPLPTSASMSPEELSSKIADSFQQFSSMLSQLSTNTASQKYQRSHNNTNAAVKSGMVTTPTAPVTPPPHAAVIPSAQQQKHQYAAANGATSDSVILSPSPLLPQKHKKSIDKPRKKAKKPAPLVTNGAKEEKKKEEKKKEEKEEEGEEKAKDGKKKEEEDDDDSMDGTKLVEVYSRYAVFNEHYNLDEILHGNTKLRCRLLIKWFNRAASIGDFDTMERMIATTDININESDDRKTGINALMYAAYFGHIQCLQLLVVHQKQKIEINQQDKKGWTALVWAAHGQQAEAVQILLENGAKTSIKTKQNRTVYEYPTITSIKKLIGDEKEPFATTAVDAPPPSIPPSPSQSALESPTTPTPNTTTIPHNEMYYQTSADGYSHFVTHHQHAKTRTSSSSSSTTISNTNAKAISTESPKLSPPDFSQLLCIKTPPKEQQQQQQRNQKEAVYVMTQEEEQTIKRWETSIKSSNTFSWNQCLPDQMFVFSQDEMHYILDHALHVSDAKMLANKSPLSNELWQPANIIFLSARFAHYCSSRELLNLLLSTTAAKLSRIIKATSRDTHTLAFWIANMCQLASYLKKDPGLSISTIDSQETLSGLISEAYTYYITESQKRLEKILSSVMDYEPIHELNQVDFVDDWQRFFRRSSNTLSNRKSVDFLSTAASNSGPTDLVDKRKYSLDASSNNTDDSVTTPQLMTVLLTDLQYILQSYHVPPAIVIQAMAQFFHYLSCEMFNRVLTYKKYLCRSKALQIRMNLSALEDWVRIQKLPSSLNQTFEPLVQLLQLLQCLSQLDDVLLFSSTIQAFDKLNALQVKRCVQNYRYEVTESRLPDQVIELANQWVVDHQHHWRNQQKTSIEIEQRTTRPASISSLNSLLTPTHGMIHELESPTASVTTNAISTAAATMTTTEEKRNSKYLLPFSIQETTALLQGWTNEQHKYVNDDDIMLYSDTIYKEIKLKKQEEYNVLDKVFPAITEEWLYSIDK